MNIKSVSRDICRWLQNIAVLEMISDEMVFFHVGLGTICDWNRLPAGSIHVSLQAIVLVRSVKLKMTSLFFIYSVSQKSSPPLKLFAILLLRLYSMKFSQFVDSLYPHRLTNIGGFILIFNTIAFICLGVLIVFTGSNFEFQQIRLP